MINGTSSGTATRSGWRIAEKLSPATGGGGGMVCKARRDRAMFDWQWQHSASLWLASHVASHTRQSPLARNWPPTRRCIIAGWHAMFVDRHCTDTHFAEAQLGQLNDTGTSAGTAAHSQQGEPLWYAQQVRHSTLFGVCAALLQNKKAIPSGVKKSARSCSLLCRELADARAGASRSISLSAPKIGPSSRTRTRTLYLRNWIVCGRLLGRREYASHPNGEISLRAESCTSGG